MVLGDLVGSIELLQERIRSHNAVLRENETRTRMALIDPLLSALGWDISDPGVVTPEFKVSGGRADYALLRADGLPAATVEAKKLGEALESHRMQMLNYANASGINYAGITDGNHWELYDVFQPSHLEEKRILKVSIANAPAQESALKLLLLWRPNLASGQQPVPAGKPILGDAPRPIPKPADAEQVPAPRPKSPDWVVLSKYNPLGGTPCPAAIRFWDGSERTLRHWYELLMLVVEKLYTEGRLTAEDVPIQYSREVYRIHTKPVHPNGAPFGNYRDVDGTLFVNVRMNARQVRRFSRDLLHRCARNPADVYLQVAQ